MASNDRCINCGLRLAHMRKHLVSDLPENIVTAVVNFWIWPDVAQPNDFLCLACWDLVQFAYQSEDQAENGNYNLPPQQVGHQNVCLLCGRSILRSEHRTILREAASNIEQRIVNVIVNWIQPREIQESDKCCVACWLRAKRVMLRQNLETNHPNDPHSSESSTEDRSPVRHPSNRNSPIIISNPNDDNEDGRPAPIPLPHEDGRPAAPMPPPHEEGFIRLPNIRRATITTLQCLFRNCPNRERHRIPVRIRQRVLKDYNFYIPEETRVCTFHLEHDMYHELYTSPESVNIFNAYYIEEIVFLLSEKISMMSEDIQTYEDNLVQYFIGITKEQHNLILNQTPRLRAMHRGSFALTALLCKLRTGDSGDRLSCLFNVPRRTVESLMAKAREIIIQDFVPLHLGFGHINRQIVASKNSLLADGLFGEPELPAETKPAIVIADGTYLYTQKSSNYLFQKDTYSLHKYRNLLKPFILVCCDGYIIDVFGLYSATTNDATIMKSLLDNEEFNNFFDENDTFILDRGFRDCMDDIHRKGYIAHMPECLEPNQLPRQLTTLQGNKSRCVTINRWVVEAVNGKFKRDFKIFRSEYFNCAARHIKDDFRIAAALINCFAIKYTDPPNAAIYLNIFQERLFLDNHLSIIVNNSNLNMRGGLFVPVDTEDFDFPRLSIQDLTLFSCGVYQIKQAKSYIGEHFRFHGIYLLEVCQDNIEGLPGLNPLLIKARLKSRHIGNRTYFVYIALDRQLHNIEAITGYCCNCIIGLRTIGCCAHVMSVIYYLGYGRHEGVNPPASFLDNVIERIII